MTERTAAPGDLQRHKREWEELAQVDPLWAILTEADRKHGRWTVAEFMARGEAEIAEVMRDAEGLGLPLRRGRSLDFGCGAGRLTQALRRRFDVAVGVDISEAMVELARRFAGETPGLEFQVNVEPDLGRFPDGDFDLVYSSLVLQHMPSRELAARYLSEFLRLLAPGGLAVFQLTASMPARKRLQIRRRLYPALRRLSLSDRFLIGSARVNPMRLIAMGPAEVEAVVEGAGGRVLKRVQEPAPPGETSYRYYAARA